MTTKIDTTKPLQLNDGTPVTLASSGYGYINVNVPQTHPLGRADYGTYSAKNNPGPRQFHDDGRRPLSLSHRQYTLQNVPTKIDWSKPIETICGVPMNAKWPSHIPFGYIVVSEGKLRSSDGANYSSGTAFVYKDDGTHAYGVMPNIRNRVEAQKLDLTKPLRTRDGRPAFFNGELKSGELLFLVYDKNGLNSTLQTRYADGRVLMTKGAESADDVINKPVALPVEQEFVNVYADGTVGKTIHRKLETARYASSYDKVRVGILQRGRQGGKIVSATMHPTIAQRRTSAYPNGAPSVWA